MTFAAQYWIHSGTSMHANNVHFRFTLDSHSILIECNVIHFLLTLHSIWRLGGQANFLLAKKLNLLFIQWGSCPIVFRHDEATPGISLQTIVMHEHSFHSHHMLSFSIFIIFRSQLCYSQILITFTYFSLLLFITIFRFLLMPIILSVNQVNFCDSKLYSL